MSNRRVSLCVAFKVVRLAWADRLRKDYFFQMCTPSLT